jgi:hypothetical protein
VWVDAALKKVKGEGSSVRVPVIRDESNKQLVHQDMYIHFLYIYIYIYIGSGCGRTWSGALDVRLSEWCCSVSMV